MEGTGRRCHCRKIVLDRHRIGTVIPADMSANKNIYPVTVEKRIIHFITKNRKSLDPAVLIQGIMVVNYFPHAGCIAEFLNEPAVLNIISIRGKTVQGYKFSVSVIK